MALPELHVSPPAVVLPSRKVGNDEVIARVRAGFRGPEADFEPIERRIRFVFRQCGTDVRYIEDHARPVAGHAARAGRACLEASGVAAADLDAVIYGGIPREYFEPATASEVAAMLGAERAAVYDVASACAGFLLGIHAFAGHAALDAGVRTGLVTCADVTENRLSHDVQTAEDLELLAAGLTIGNASAAMVVSRAPLPSCGRIVATLVQSLPAHHALTRAPVDGHFVCRSADLFALARHVPDHVREVVRRAGWKTQDVRFIASHQPSERLIREVSRKLGLSREQVPSVHHLYGNTAASSVPLAFATFAPDLRPGDRVVLSTQAAGFVMCSLALEWVA